MKFMPHRSLRLDNLSKLPVSYRRLANAAVNGTAQDLSEFVNLCVKSPYSKPVLFLPVFFANLDPVGLPTLDQLDSLARDTGTKDLIDATPGVRVVIARAWVLFLELDDCLSSPGFHDVCRFLITDLKTSKPVNLQEVIEGAGGSVVDLQALLVKHIEYVVGTNQRPSEATTFFLVGITGVVDEIHYDGTLQKALLSAGIVKALVSATLFLAGTRLPSAIRILRDCFTLLSKVFTTHAAPMCIPDALLSGLLRVICTCAVTHVDDLRDHMNSLLKEVLPPAMVYYSVIKCMENALMEARLKIARAYESGIYPPGRACDNPECGSITDKRDIKRCAACQRLAYCSPDFQTAHWRQGGHRAVCKRLRASRQTEPLTTRDRSFLRALAHHDYIFYHNPIFLDTVEVYYEFPDEAHYLLFDYTQGTPTIEVLSIAKVEVPPTPSDFQVQWSDHVTRAALSGGKMQVAIMRFVQGGVSRFGMISIHSKTSAVPDGLRRISNGTPQGTDFDARVLPFCPSFPLHRILELCLSVVRGPCFRSSEFLTPEVQSPLTLPACAAFIPLNHQSGLSVMMSTLRRANDGEWAWKTRDIFDVNQSIALTIKEIMHAECRLIATAIGKLVDDHDSTGNSRVKELFLFSHPYVDHDVRCSEDAPDLLKGYVYHGTLFRNAYIVAILVGILDAYSNIPFVPVQPAKLFDFRSMKEPEIKQKIREESKKRGGVDQSRCKEETAIAVHACFSCLAAAERVDLKRCGRCKVVWYCSSDCQKKDWVDHRKFCGKEKFDSKLPVPSPQPPDEFIGCPAVVPGFFRTLELWLQIESLSREDSQAQDYHVSRIFTPIPVPFEFWMTLVPGSSFLSRAAVPWHLCGYYNLTVEQIRRQFEIEYRMTVSDAGRQSAGPFAPPMAQELEEERSYLRQRLARAPPQEDYV
ncbi:hypothetical protein DFH09DRAFT_1367508 [Mycena vulgaris]|nr:hypothetical protein DFH09DRAFT_1367508 [Mycena vulgaris]